MAHGSNAGLGQIFKDALPIVGRVGAVAGGMVGILNVFEKFSGQLVTAIEGLLLLTAVITSALVVTTKTTKVVEEKTIKVPNYPKRHRVVAGGVLAISSVLLLLFVIRIGMDLLNSTPERQQQNIAARATQLSKQQPAQSTADRLRQLTGTISPGAQTNIARTPPPTFTFAPTVLPSLTFTPAPPTVTPTPNVAQLTDINTLNRLGQEALNNKTYDRAVFIFNRALQVEATNAQAQYGLGVGYFYLNNYNAAFNPLSTALRLNPDFREAHAYLGFIYDYRQDYVKARVEYEEYIRIAPQNAPLRNDVNERLKVISGRGSPPTLTPYSTATSSPTLTPTEKITPTLSTPTITGAPPTSTSTPAITPSGTRTP